MYKVFDSLGNLMRKFSTYQAAHYKQPCLDYPYIGIPDKDEEEILK